MACSHYPRILIEEVDRYYINSLEHNNCVFCLIQDKGPMVQEEVGKYFGVGKMRISQIEQIALKKINKINKKIK
jgi:hypothetical protein